MWLVGLMGHSAQKANVSLLLAALDQCLRRQGFVPSGSGPAAAEAIYLQAR